jgi:predicted metal-binding membrane protein
LFVAAALLFLGSAALTLSWAASMSGMPGMEMPGGWTMSMAWMRMPGQSWSEAALSFLGMWLVMMIAMMLPAVAPGLWRYRQSLAAAGVRPDGLTAAAGAGYFSVWTAFGALAFPPGVLLAAAEMRMPSVARAVPFAAAVCVMVAGALQASRWKARQLECCAGLHRPALPPTLSAAWRHGVRLGLDCCRCCAPFTLLLFVAGVMDLAAMALVTIVISFERWAAERSARTSAPPARRIARAIGVAMSAVGAGYLALQFARSLYAPDAL